ncbi:MAG TPA: type IV secretion system DNA-binding domain-containing protein [Bdellovibrionota bacterium]|nr:type IV secretion system DNA-binding domain-containing protein [Bdellovibrionota bacterium]
MLPDFSSPVWPWHWQLTPQQYGLAGGLGVLLLLMIVAEHGVPWRLLSLVVRGLRLGRLLWFLRSDQVVLGSIALRDSDRVRHCHIVGSPGSGKTEATKSLIFEDIRRGRGCFIIDAKGDRELYEEVRGFAKSVGRESDVYLISATYPEESAIWNPCGLGNASELQSKFLNANIYSEPYYAKACEYGLIQAFNRLTQSKPSGFALPDLVRELKYLAEKQKNDALEGLFFDFGSLVESEWAEILACKPSRYGQPEISLLDIVLGNKILFVDLPTEGRSVQSSRVGRVLTQELILISGLRKGFPALNQQGVFSVYIDEFDAFATESFATFLNKGRSSNFMIHIAHQTISDLKKISQEFAGQILGLCNVHIVFRQDDPDDSEFWARFFGTRATVKTTHQTQSGSKTGQGTSRETMEFVIGPDRIKNLGVGQCIISIKTKKLTRLTKLPLPKSFRAFGKTPQIEREPLSGRRRSPVSAPSEKTTAEEARDLSAENFHISSKKSQPAPRNPADQGKWDLVPKKQASKTRLEREDNHGYTETRD